jgi:hypothetical protein
MAAFDKLLRWLCDCNPLKNIELRSVFVGRIESGHKFREFFLYHLGLSMSLRSLRSVAVF